MEIGKSAGKSFAYILGVFLGDGCVTGVNGRLSDFKLNTIDEDFAAATKDALLDLTGKEASIYKHAVSKSSKPNHSLYLNHVALCHVLQSDTLDKSIIPEYVIEWPVELRRQFIAGLMDSEGFVAANKNPTNRRYYMGFKSCDPWVHRFIEILGSVGVMVGKVATEIPRKAGYKVPTRFTIKMKSWIDAGCFFNIKRKQDRVLAWASYGAYENRAKFPRRLTSETTRQTA